MANKERGEVTIQAGDASYTIRLNNKQLCNLEDDMGLDIQAILGLFDGKMPSMNQSRQIFRRGLAEHHGEKTLDEVSEIIDSADYMVLVAGLLSAIAGAFPTTTGSIKKKGKK